jgi:ATP-dependent DNA helicase RecG
MMVEGAEKFGLASLHQFRGRVGRGEYQSYCLLFPTSESHEENERLKAVALSHNGFLLAEKDLKIRGPGNLAGFEQSGFHIPLQESLMDVALVEKTSKAARHIIDTDPQFKKYPLLAKRLDALAYTLHAE